MREDRIGVSDLIIEALEEGRTVVINCSVYEDVYWLKDDKFKVSTQRKYCEDPDPAIEKTKDQVRSAFDVALRNSDLYRIDISYS